MEMQIPANSIKDGRIAFCPHPLPKVNYESGQEPSGHWKSRKPEKVGCGWVGP